MVIGAAVLMVTFMAAAQAQTDTNAAPPPNQSSSSGRKSGTDQKPAAPAADENPQSSSSTQAQQPQSTATPATTDNKDQKNNAQKSGISKDRIFWTLPNFLTVENSDKVPPLTAGQKFKAVGRSTFDPVEFGIIGITALIGQASNSEPAYGQGAEGYGKRYVTNLADAVIENFVVGAAFPAVLRQDPRYYQLGKGTFLRRTTYAISRLFIGRSDSGHKEFNYSEVFGSAFAAAVSTYSYHPKGDKTLSNTASVWGTQIAMDTVSVMLKEFWPDIRRKFGKEKRQQQP
jgi:hypothetical protein